VHTTWLEQDHEWEAGAKAWAVGLLADEELGAYAERLAARAERIVLGMTLLKLTVPGVPDLYQGDELPLLALVDPDNRRPVDFEERRRLLASAEPPPKLDLIRRTLALRARRPAAFAGSYEPVEAGEDVVAFARGGEVLVAVALRGDLGGFRAPAGTWADVYRTPQLLLAERT
jgi:(1->4)-alpha-D-glucan 1-alpha-D-glucosylmutase